MKHPIGISVLAMFLGAAAAPLSQGGCAGGTGSKRFLFRASVGGVSRGNEGPFTFANQTGWTITLTKADMTVGPVYLNVVPPLSEAPQSFLGHFVKNAWAVGEGALGSGRIVGEVLGQVKFNALAAELVPFPVLGSMTEDEVRTAEIWFYPEPGVAPETTKIDTVALDVAGEASREGKRFRFRGALVLNDAWQADASTGKRGNLAISEVRKVRGIQSSFFAKDGGRLEVRVDIKRLFRGADFSNLEGNPSDKDGTKILVQSKTGKVTTDQVMTNLYQGLRENRGTYSVIWLAPSSPVEAPP